MRNSIFIAVVVASATLTMLTAQSSRNAEVQFKAAQEKEQVQGDLKGAIKAYEKIAAGKDRFLAAKALLREAECYKKLGDSDARKMYERLIRQFPDQTGAVAEARAQLAGFERPAAQVAGPQSGRVGALYTAGIDLNTGKLTSIPELVPNQPSGISDDPAWSPDGKLLAYITHTRDQGILSILSWSTGQRREIHDYTQLTNLLWPHWAPDGRSLVAQGRDLKGNDGIYRVDVATGTIQPVVIGDSGKHLSFPMVTPDGKRLIYCRMTRESGEMLERDLTSNTERRLLDGVRPNTTGMPVLSPNGQYIHYVVFDNTTGDSTLSVLPLAGSASRELLRVKRPQLLGTGTWTPDGQSVVYSISASEGPAPLRPKDLWLVPLAGGNSRRLELPEGSQRARLHPDGKTVVFVNQGLSK